MERDNNSHNIKSIKPRIKQIFYLFNLDFKKLASMRNYNVSQ